MIRKRRVGSRQPESARPTTSRSKGFLTLGAAAAVSLIGAVATNLISLDRADKRGSVPSLAAGLSALILSVLSWRETSRAARNERTQAEKAAEQAEEHLRKAEEQRLTAQRDFRKAQEELLRTREGSADEPDSEKVGQREEEGLTLR